MKRWSGIFRRVHLLVLILSLGYFSGSQNSYLFSAVPRRSWLKLKHQPKLKPEISPAVRTLPLSVWPGLIRVISAHYPRLACYLSFLPSHPR
jgi:hypothetical protein